MSAPMHGQFALKYFCNVLVNKSANYQVVQTTCRCYSVFDRISKKVKEFRLPDDEAYDASQVKAPTKVQPTDVTWEIGTRKRQCIEEVKSYEPPADVEDHLQKLVSDIYKISAKSTDTDTTVATQSDSWKDIKLTDRMKKYKLLAKAIDRFDHDIPNLELHTMETVNDVLKFYQTGVSDKNFYDQMADMDLPKNLHMNVEPMRWDPETDQLYGGKTAFPGSPTIVSSVKYRRKYKGHPG